MVLPDFAATALQPSRAPLRVLTLTAGRRWTPTDDNVATVKLTTTDGIVFKVPHSAITRACPDGKVNATAQTLHAALHLITFETLPPEWAAHPFPERCRQIVVLVIFLIEYECHAALATLKAKHGTDAKHAPARMRETFPLQAFVLGIAAQDAAFCEHAIRGNLDAFTATDSLDLTRDTARVAACMVSSPYWKALARSHAVANGSTATWATAFRNRVEESYEDDDDTVDEGGSVLDAAVAMWGIGTGMVIQWAQDVSALRANAWITFP